MAVTAAAAALTRAHKLDQSRIRAAAIAELMQTWPMLSLDNINATSQSWLAMMLALVQRWRGRSAQLAGQYYTELRARETDQVVPPMLMLAATPDPGQVVTSLLVTGPIGLKARIGRGVPPEKASKLSLIETQGAVARHVLNGGRQTLLDTAQADPRAVGYARVTDGNPCPFCAMLASRGGVYRSRESALFADKGVNRYHDHCGCTVEPMFTRGALPEASARYERLWAESTRGKSGKAAMGAFAAALDAA